MSQELLPCPFCGAEMRADYDRKSKMYGPEGDHKEPCIFANADMHEWSDEALLAQHWNTRSPPPLAVGTLEEMIKRLVPTPIPGRVYYRMIGAAHSTLAKWGVDTTAQNASRAIDAALLVLFNVAQRDDNP